MSKEIKKVIVSLGNTEEYIDPTKILTTKSSGKMGLEIVKALLYAIHNIQIIIIRGKNLIEKKEWDDLANNKDQIIIKDITTADNMLDTINKTIDEVEPDVYISLMSVCDWKLKHPSEEKLKKEEGIETLTLELVKTVDILETVAQSKKIPFTSGFAVETSIDNEDMYKKLHTKLEKKGCDLMIGNDVSTIGQDKTSLYLLDNKGNQSTINDCLKKDCANFVISTIENLFQKENNLP